MTIEKARHILSHEPGMFCADEIEEAIRADERERLAALFEQGAVSGLTERESRTAALAMRTAMMGIAFTGEDGG